MFFKLNCTFASLYLLSLTFIQAQVQTDGSVGPEQSLTGPNYMINEDLGRRVGNNLFHSFSEFSIRDGESATFTGASEIANVISRVTGGKVSTIDGHLKSDIPDANFYFINSAGILFGPNASLSINGSFYASTADYVRLGNGDLFYSESLQGEILSTAAPTAFGFFKAPSRGVTVIGSQLDLEENMTLSLVGAEVAVKDGANIQIPEGQTNLVGVNAGGEVVFGSSGGHQDLDVGSFEQLNAVTIRDSKLNVDGAGGGRVVIRGGQMVLSDSIVSARTTGDQSGKGVDMMAGELRFLRSRIDTTTTGSGNAGDVLMDASALVLNGVGVPEGVGMFASSTNSVGKAGAIMMKADRVDVLGNVGIEATAELPADTGTINLSTSTLKWNGFDAEFEINSGRGELIRSGSGNIILDGSFDPDLDGFTLDGPNYSITEDLGQTSGNNLFHSFRVFFVDEGETATFSGPETISNIITRVTGDMITSIYGQLISDIPGANLYLINPNGLFFGASDTLDLSGSFHVTTADYLNLADGGRFSASIPAESVLDGSEVSAYGFIDDEIGEIAVENARLKLQDNKTISLIGGSLSLRDKGRLVAFSGQINLISLQSAGEASILDGSNDVDASEFSKSGNILVDYAAANVSSSQTNSSSPAGRLFVRGDDLRLDNDGEFRARNYGEGTGGIIDVLITGDLFIGKDSALELSGEGLLGQVSIEAENLTIDGTGQSLKNGFTGMDISQSKKDVAANRSENALKITVTETLNIINGGVVDVATFGDVNAGSATIRARNLIIDHQGSDYFTGIFSASGDIGSNEDSTGNGGELDIIVDELLQITNGGFVNSSTYSLGDGGKVTIQAKNLTINNRSAILSLAIPKSFYDNEKSDITGNGGELNITVEEQLLITNGGVIDASTIGPGDAGSAKIYAKNLIIDGQGHDFSTGIASLATMGSTGDGGDLDITVEEQLQIDYGGITASAETGNAGNLRISAGSDIRIANGFLGISAGQEDFDVNDLDNFRQPELIVEAGNSISVQNSTLSTNAGVLGSERGAGGDIYLLAPAEIRLENSVLSAQSGYEGGNIFIDPFFYIVISSDIIAQADIQGGNYSVIVTNPFGWIQSADSQINLSGRQSGAVLSNISPFDLGAELSDLDTDFLNAEEWALQPCEFRLGGTGSSFVITGWRGVSYNLDDFLPSEPILIADYDFATVEPVDDEFLQKVMFPELNDGCDDCP